MVADHRYEVEIAVLFHDTEQIFVELFGFAFPDQVPSYDGKEGIFFTDAFADSLPYRSVNAIVAEDDKAKTLLRIIVHILDALEDAVYAILLPVPAQQLLDFRVRPLASDALSHPPGLAHGLQPSIRAVGKSGGVLILKSNDFHDISWTDI